jgi:hypothetical protein
VDGHLGVLTSRSMSFHGSYSCDTGKRLLNSLLGSVATDQVFKNCQHMSTVFNDPLEHRAKVRLALAFSVPFGQYGRGNGDVPSEFLRFVPAQEKPVEKSRFALRKLEILQHFLDRIGLRAHIGKGSLQVSALPSRVRTH